MENSRLLFACKVYRRPFRIPVRTSQGLWEAREGIFLRIEDENGRVAFGEIAPIERFGSETVAGALAWCATIGAQTERSRIQPVPRTLPCCAWAVASALHALEPAEPAGSPAGAKLAVCALLPTGKAALAHLEQHAGDGFTTFKTKIGAAEFATEVEMIERLVDNLPSGARLRLDANGALDVRSAIRWLDRAQSWPVEFIEQPLAVDARREMIALAHDHGVPLAIDEAVRTADDVKRWRDGGWPGIFIIKPALAGDPLGWMPEVALDPRQFVFSSALETEIGTVAGLRQALSSGSTRAVGYGVGTFFEDDGLGGGAGAPEIDVEAVSRRNLEEVWKRI